MQYSFEDYRLDSETRELTKAGAPVALEPQVFDLLVLLVEFAHRVVSKDEIIERVWYGRVVSDWAVLGRIKGLRQALGDDGNAQRLIRTLRGHGFRFVGDVSLMSTPAAVARPSLPDPVPPKPTGPPCIAVLPFSAMGDLGAYGPLAEAIPREVIRSLSSLRWLKVIAHGSSFRFRGQSVDLDTVRDLLSADYCVTGALELHDGRVSADVEMADARSGEVVWSTRKTATLSDVHLLRAEIAADIVNVSEFELPLHESSISELDLAENLDAWSALHLGFKHMYRLNPKDTETARHYFEQAARLEPGLARAHAGLSFASFQRVFLGYSKDLGADRTAARASAEMSISLEPRDPFANVVMGRSHWLVGETESSIPWFDRAVLESPNYAFGRYASSWAKVFTADYAGGGAMTDYAISLSPLDPMRAGMLCNKMWIALAAGDHPAAVDWAEQTARTPGAHAGHAFFAAMAHMLNGAPDAAQNWLQETRRRNPSISLSKAMALVPHNHLEFRQLTQQAATDLGLTD